MIIRDLFPAHFSSFPFPAQSHLKKTKVFGTNAWFTEPFSTSRTKRMCIDMLGQITAGQEFLG